MKQSLLVIGLGNPGKEYENTRHNVGFHAIETITKNLSIDLSFQKSCKALVGKHNFSNGNTAIFAMPLTFMNLSGEAVLALLKWYEISPLNCIVITDNIDLPVARLRVKQKGSGGTHNGIRSIHKHLQSLEQGLDYIRLYIGVGSHRQGQALSKYVLGTWHSSEDEDYQNAFELASQSIVHLCELQPSVLEQEHNKKNKEGNVIANTLSSYIAVAQNNNATNEAKK